jgi:hypothetical protein
MKIAHENCGDNRAVIENNDSACHGAACRALGGRGWYPNQAGHHGGRLDNTLRGANRRPEGECGAQQGENAPLV